MKILFLVPYPLGESPSQRFRFEQYLKILQANGDTFSVQSFLNKENWRLFFSSGRHVQKVVAVIGGYCKRVAVLFKVNKYDFVFIHREVTPLGPPIFEWIISKVFRKRIIYDFDDAIWLTDRKNESIVFRILKWRSKVGSISKWSYRVSCGNEYLCTYASRFNRNVVFNPTTIDTENVHNPALFRKTNLYGKVVIGWTGSHSTLKYLSLIEPVLQQIESSFSDVHFLVIADRKPDLKLTRFHFSPWTAQTEIADLANIDIGIMPLVDDEWAKGKCGFKALQYMAMEIATVASPVGVNSAIIQDGENGLLANDNSTWLHALSLLVNDSEMRKRIGRHGRTTVIQAYSVASNSANFLALFAR